MLCWKVSLHHWLIRSVNWEPPKPSPYYHWPYCVRNGNIRIKTENWCSLKLKSKWDQITNNISMNNTTAKFCRAISFVILLEKLNPRLIVAYCQNFLNTTSVHCSFDENCKECNKHHRTLKGIRPHYGFDTTLKMNKNRKFKLICSMLIKARRIIVSTLPWSIYWINLQLWCKRYKRT